MEDDERDPDDAGGVHCETDELGLVEVLGQITRLERVQRTHGYQQKVESERHEHSHVGGLAAGQLSDVNGRVDLCRVIQFVLDGRYCHHRNLGSNDDSGYYDLQQYTTRTASLLSMLFFTG